MAMGVWKPAVGTETAAIRLANLWKTVCMAAFTTVLEYESNDFQKGADPTSIIAAGNVLRAPLEIDSRGGFIGQDEFEAGIQLLCSSTSEIKVGFEKAAAAKGIDLASTITVAVFKLRIMLAHVRMKRRVWLKQDESVRTLADPTLMGLYNTIQASADNPGKPTKPNPFTNFRRTGESDDEEELDDAVVKTVSTYFDPCKRKVVTLQSDGAMVAASQYTKQEDGFVRAEWLDVSGNVYHVFNTEVPNSCLQNGELFESHPTSTVEPDLELGALTDAPVMRKPASRRVSTKKTAEEDNAEPENKPKEEEAEPEDTPKAEPNAAPKVTPKAAPKKKAKAMKKKKKYKKQATPKAEEAEPKAAPKAAPKKKAKVTPKAAPKAEEAEPEDTPKAEPKAAPKSTQASAMKKKNKKQQTGAAVKKVRLTLP